MRIDKRLSLSDSNNLLSEYVKSNNPFLVSRVGLGGETIVSVLTLNKLQINDQVKHWFFVNAGFYGSQDFETYASLYKESCDLSELHAYWNFPGFIEMEDFLVPENKPLIEPGSLESFRFEDPWTQYLENKNILIISPFKETIDSQLQFREKIWKNKNVLPNANYITYKSVQSIGGSGPHKDWYESLDVMYQDISKINFDIALLGCGSYGLPLSMMIRKNLNKSAVYIGGGLQLYFGIKGKRWDNGDDKVFYNDYWVRPSELEKPRAGNLVEGGCYW
jgi:hypothetical protein